MSYRVSERVGWRMALVGGFELRLTGRPLHSLQTAFTRVESTVA